MCSGLRGRRTARHTGLRAALLRTFARTIRWTVLDDTLCVQRQAHAAKERMCAVDEIEGSGQETTAARKVENDGFGVLMLVLMSTCDEQVLSFFSSSVGSRLSHRARCKIC